MSSYFLSWRKLFPYKVDSFSEGDSNNYTGLHVPRQKVYVLLLKALNLATPL